MGTEGRAARAGRERRGTAETTGGGRTPLGMPIVTPPGCRRRRTSSGIVSSSEEEGDGVLGRDGPASSGLEETWRRRAMEKRKAKKEKKKERKGGRRRQGHSPKMRQTNAGRQELACSKTARVARGKGLVPESPLPFKLSRRRPYPSFRPGPLGDRHAGARPTSSPR